MANETQEDNRSNMSIIVIATIIDLIIMGLGMNYIKANYTDHALLLSFSLLAVVMTATMMILKSFINRR
jgi:uncharacterized membrane protein